MDEIAVIACDLALRTFCGWGDGGTGGGGRGVGGEGVLVRAANWAWDSKRRRM